MDSGTGRNGLSEADLDVPAKLLEQRLDRREEAEALARRPVVAEDDLLQLGIGKRVEVEVAGQVAAWMSRRLGRKVWPQRGWDYLRKLEHSLQMPRPKHAKAASAEEQDAFKKLGAAGR